MGVACGAGFPLILHEALGAGPVYAAILNATQPIVIASDSEATPHAKPLTYQMGLLCHSAHAALLIPRNDVVVGVL